MLLSGQVELAIGYSYFLPASTPGMAESGMNTYLAKVHQYGKPAPGAKTLESDAEKTKETTTTPAE